jgi:hypothetical protein
VAPVLLCPECGTKHPLDNVADISSFPCSGCGRTLKVPAQARELSAVRRDGGSPPPLAPVAPAPVAETHATQVLPVAAPSVAAPAAAAVAAVPAVPVAPPLGPPQGIPALDYKSSPRIAVEPAHAKPPMPVPPAWVRFLLWIVAVPLAFLIVFGIARGLGLLTTNEITDVALAEGWGRFWPIVRLLPFVALATALLVTGGVYGITKLRMRNKPQGGSAARPPKAPSDQSARTLV